MNLFEYNRQKNNIENAPLYLKMCPQTLEDFYGQSHIIGENKLLYRMIKSDKITSIIFYGPPGTGKTTLSKIIANTTNNNFEQINATSSGIKEIKDIIEKSKNLYEFNEKKTILFVDEIHRFNKAQQDSLLPYIEDGTIIFIGATTENPYFEVNKALISRSIIFELKPLDKEDIKNILKKALYNNEKGLGKYNVDITDDAIDFISSNSNGDARIALNAIEIAILTTKVNIDNRIFIDIDVAQECIQKKTINYDKNGSNHYDIVSAFIKSMRGSDPDAALYYLARMIYAGEDLNFIARRIIICASEDVGNADPHALMLAVSVANAINFVGMPEARIILAQAVTYISCAPKSNSCYLGIDEALKDVEEIDIKTIPNHLKDCHYKYSKNLGHIGYKYVHDFPNNYIKQQYLPDELINKKYYRPSNNGIEKRINEFLNKIRY